MAEENMDQIDDSDAGTNGGGGTSQNGGSSNVSQTTECIQSYIKNSLEGQIEYTKSQETIACLDYKGKITVQNYNLCLLLKSRALHDEYFGIKNCISTTLLGQSSLVDENVDNYLVKTDAIKKALDNSLNAIKESKSKIWKIRECACKLDGARNDSCNSEQLSAMNKIPQGDPDNKSGIARFHALVDDLVNQSNTLYDTIDDIFEKGVKVAGIQAYINTKSLKEFSESLKGDATSLDTDINTNLSYAEDLIDTAQEQYTDGLNNLDNCLFAKNESHLAHLSLEAAESYADGLKDESCDGDSIEALEEICIAIQDEFKKVRPE